jgi:metalloendopeptidase OMA1, mitochondrial
VRRILLALLLLAVAACETVPLTGRSQLLLVSEGEETRIGVDAYRGILNKSKISSDPRLNDQVMRVGRRIADATGRRDYEWECKVLDDPQANAFCLPGGKVAVYTGILPITRDDAGLAAVLGHEVAHAVARHGGERMSQTILVQSSLAATQTVLAGNDPVVVQSVTALLGAGASVGLLLPWSRSQESDADHLGLIYMAKAGYNPIAARDLWARMGDASRNSAAPPALLSTHPSAATRVTQIEGWTPEALQYYRPP